MRIRANPAYQFRTFAKLSARDVPQLDDLRRDPRLAGVLLPAERASLPSKAICRHSAALFASLEQPVVAGDSPISASENAVAELVLDEILEVDDGRGFVSGPAALLVVRPDRRWEEPPRNRLAALTRGALIYASELDSTDAEEVAAKLYFYNRLPVAPSSLRRWPNANAVGEFLGLDVGGGYRKRLERLYWTDEPADVGRPWSKWRSRDASARPSHDIPLYKLYLSPDPGATPAAVGELVSVLLAMPVGAFKICRDVFGLLRPDKIVCYFERFDELEAFAADYRTRVEGCLAHGVPFSTSFTDDGLLSWGLDPPVRRSRANSAEPQSWRLWVATVAAQALCTAQRSELPRGVAPWHFALEKLAMAGVNTATWMVDPTVWRSAWQDSPPSS